MHKLGSDDRIEGRVEACGIRAKKHSVRRVGLSDGRYVGQDREAANDLDLLATREWARIGNDFDDGEGVEILVTVGQGPRIVNVVYGVYRVEHGHIDKPEHIAGRRNDMHKPGRDHGIEEGIETGKVRAEIHSVRRVGLGNGRYVGQNRKTANNLDLLPAREWARIRDNVDDGEGIDIFITVVEGGGVEGGHRVAKDDVDQTEGITRRRQDMNVMGAERRAKRGVIIRRIGPEIHRVDRFRPGKGGEKAVKQDLLAAWKRPLIRINGIDVVDGRGTREPAQQRPGEGGLRWGIPLIVATEPAAAGHEHSQADKPGACHRANASTHVLLLSGHPSQTRPDYRS